MANRRSGQRTAFGFLTFESLADAREAKEDAHNMEIDGNMYVFVKFENQDCSVLLEFAPTFV